MFFHIAPPDWMEINVELFILYYIIAKIGEASNARPYGILGLRDAVGGRRPLRYCGAAAKLTIKKN
jgi:hypothetical protein